MAGVVSSILHAIKVSRLLSSSLAVALNSMTADILAAVELALTTLVRRSYSLLTSATSSVLTSSALLRKLSYDFVVLTG